MLGNLNVEFDHADFQRKLRHYFMDSAPVKVDLVIKADSVLIKVPTTSKEVEYFLQSDKSVKDNIHDLAVLCETSIYPTLEKTTVSSRTLSIEERKQYLIQGLSLEEIENRATYLKVSTLYIARISIPSMTMIIKRESGETYLAQFKQPLMRVLSTLSEMTPAERYEYITAKSTIKEITHEV